MADPKRSTRQAIATLTALSVLTVAVNAHQHPQSLINATNDISHRHLEPRRKPPKVDRAKRMNALPPIIINTGTNTLPINTLQQHSAPIIQTNQSPYYPSLSAGTCLNDNNYPDYYLYDVKSYFFHSPKECCERHFGNSVGTKGGGMLQVGGVTQCLVGVGVMPGEMTKMLPVMSGLEELQTQQLGMKTATGGNTLFMEAKAGKMEMPGSSGVTASSGLYPGNMGGNAMINGQMTVPGGTPALPGQYPEPSASSGKSGKIFGQPPSSVGSGKSDKMYEQPSSSMGSGKSGKSVQVPQHSGKLFSKPTISHSPTGAVVKGDKMNGWKGSNPTGKPTPSKTNPKPMTPNASPPPPSSSSMKNSGKNHVMPGSSSWGSDSKTSKPPEMSQMPPKQLPPGLNDASKTSNKYVMPPKRPPPPELAEYQGWNYDRSQPSYSEMPHSKSGKAKSHKSAKAKSAKSKAGKAKASAPWWGGGDDDYTYSPTYMPTESDDRYQMGWMGGGLGQQNNMPGDKPGNSQPGGAMPGNMRPNVSGWGGQYPAQEKPKPEWGGSSSSGAKPTGNTPGNWWGGQQSGQEMPNPGWGGSSAINPSGGKPPGINPSSWWGGQQAAPQGPKPGWGGSSSANSSGGKPSQTSGKHWGSDQGYWWGDEQPKPQWGGSSATNPSGGKPGHWWGGQQTKPERPHPGWGGMTSTWGAWNTPAWGNSWWGSESAHAGSQLGSGWNSWGNGNLWWGNSGGGSGSKVPIPSMPTSKPSTSAPTAKPTGLFPIETIQPTNSPVVIKLPTYSPISQGIPTYSPSNPFPTYSPTPAGSTYSPTPAGNTHEPSPSSATYLPTPSKNSYVPTGTSEKFPTFSPTGEGGTPAPTDETTPSPTSEPLELCVWGSAYSSGLEDEGDVLSVPFSTGIYGVHASAGSKYSLIVEASGSAFASGYIEDLNSYHGYLGVQQEDLQQVRLISSCGLVISIAKTC
jgi:hypothetical protein